jgi:hypothetical protein
MGRQDSPPLTAGRQVRVTERRGLNMLADNCQTSVGWSLLIRFSSPRLSASGFEKYLAENARMAPVYSINIVSSFVRKWVVNNYYTGRF